jgi:hypothetical protein
MAAKVSPIEIPPPEVRQNKADRYGELRRRLQLIEPDKDEAEALKKEMEAWYPGALPEKARGLFWEVQMSARRKERTIKNKWKLFNRLRKALGIRGVIALITIPLGEVDKVIPESERKVYFHEEQSGWRTFTVVPVNPITPEGNDKAA